MSEQLSEEDGYFRPQEASAMAMTLETQTTWEAYLQEKNPELRERLILQYAPMVKFAVSRLAISLPAVIDVEDLVSYGIIGLIDAIERFDLSRGVKFETFALPRIRGAVLDQLRQLDWLPRSSRQHAKDIQRTISQLRDHNGCVPTDQEVAGELGMDIRRYHVAVQEAATITLSLDLVMNADDDDSPTTLADFVEDKDSANIGGPIERAELVRALAHAIDQLADRERTVIALRYHDALTMKEISQVLAISESRVCQLHARTLLKLRTKLVYFQEPARAA